MKITNIGLCPLQLRYLKDIKNLTSQTERNSLLSLPAALLPNVITGLFIYKVF